MIKSYFRSAVRNLRANKVSSLINVVGLSIALASAITVYLFLQVYYMLDTFHEHAERIVMVEHEVTRDGETQTWGTAPLPLGPALAADLPQVERAVRLAWSGGDVRTDGATFEERIAFADAGFFDVFTFPLQAGTPAALTEPGTAVLSDAAARKFFGDADAVGRRLTVSAGGAGALAVTVGAVAAPFPNTASFRFSVLLPFSARPDAARPDDWSAEAVATFLLLRRPGDAPAVVAHMNRLLPRVNEAVPDAPIDRFVAETLSRPGPRAHKVNRRPTEAPDPILVSVLIGLAACMMALACVNAVNIALGGAYQRVREIGVRKVLGGTRGQLVAQFMAEHVLLCAVALGAGVGVAWLFTVPLFNRVFVLQIDWSLASDPGLWAALAGLLLVVSVASGAYPALVGASFEPARILRGAVRPAATRRLVHGLTLAQFVLAFVAVIGTVVLAVNGRHFAGQAWGYDRDGVVVVPLPDPSLFGPLRDAAAGRAGVLQVAGTPDHVGATLGRARFALGSEAPDVPPAHEARVLDVGPGYAEAVGLRLHSGRLFDERLASDTASVVVNARLARSVGWADAVGQTLRFDGQEVTVVGVVEDFLYDPLIQPGPLVLRASAAPPAFLVVRAVPGSERAVEAALAADWARLAPDLPFEAFAQTEVFDAQIESYTNLARGIGTLAALALLIACMGVFGLASQNVARQMKEASVRKVLGASVAGLVVRVNRPVLVILAVAGTVTTAASAVGLHVLAGLGVLNLAPLTPVPFVAAYLLISFAVAVSVAAQSRTLVLANPADVLRRE